MSVIIRSKILTCELIKFQIQLSRIVIYTHVWKLMSLTVRQNIALLLLTTQI